MPFSTSLAGQALAIALHSNHLSTSGRLAAAQALQWRGEASSSASKLHLLAHRRLPATGAWEASTQEQQQAVDRQAAHGPPASARRRAGGSSGSDPFTGVQRALRAGKAEAACQLLDALLLSGKRPPASLCDQLVGGGCLFFGSSAARSWLCLPHPSGALFAPSQPSPS